MSTLEINSILSTPNILSPLDSPSMMNSTVDQNPLTQSIIEQKKVVSIILFIIEQEKVVFIIISIKEQEKSSL